jgi:predicted nucleic acid-binding protein
VANYLLASNHANRLVDPHHPMRQRIRAAIARGDTFYVILPVITETVCGFSMLPRAVRNRLEWQVVRPSLALLDLDEAHATDAADLQVRLRRGGRQLTIVDAFIAAAALRDDLIVLTTDNDFGHVPELRRENWLAL